MRWPWCSRTALNNAVATAIADQRTAHAVEMTRTNVTHLADLVDTIVKTRRDVVEQLTTRIETRADAYRLDAEHPTSGRAHTAPFQQGLTPELRLVVEHELRDAARDIRHMNSQPERTPA